MSPTCKKNDVLNALHDPEVDNVQRSEFYRVFDALPNPEVDYVPRFETVNWWLYSESVLP